LRVCDENYTLRLCEVSSTDWCGQVDVLGREVVVQSFGDF
jgi:hypothetical protein